MLLALVCVCAGAASFDTLQPFDEDILNGDREASQALKASWLCLCCYLIGSISSMVSHRCYLIVVFAVFHISAGSSSEENRAGSEVEETIRCSSRRCESEEGAVGNCRGEGILIGQSLSYLIAAP